MRCYQTRRDKATNQLCCCLLHSMLTFHYKLCMNPVHKRCVKYRYCAYPRHLHAAKCFLAPQLESRGASLWWSMWLWCVLQLEVEELTYTVHFNTNIHICTHRFVHPRTSVVRSIKVAGCLARTPHSWLLKLAFITVGSVQCTNCTYTYSRCFPKSKDWQLPLFNSIFICLWSCGLW